MGPVAIFENTFGKKEDIQTYIKFSIFVLFLVCLFSRVCIYLFPKDLWLDEAFLFGALNKGRVSELVSGHLTYNQSAPFLFVMINKLIITSLGSKPAIIRFLPFICSLISVIILLKICNKIGNSLYIFSVMLIFSLCFTPIYYAGEFKQYSVEMLISLLVLSGAINDVYPGVNQYSLLSLKNTIFYIFCISCSSTGILFLAGILLAQIIIVWRRMALRDIKINYWNIFVLAIFIAAYYFFYLKSGNSQQMKNYWNRFMIPLDWSAFWGYWGDTGVKIFQVLFAGPRKFSAYIFVGLVGGSIMLWRKERDLFLLLSMPIVVTFAANAVFYPPGDPWQPVGGRLLLFLLPNGVLVAGWFYAWVFSKLVAFATRQARSAFWTRIRQLGCVTVLCGLAFGSMLANANYLYGMAYKVQQIAELVRIFQVNSTSESLNLVYGGAQPAYNYYEGLSGRKLPVETMRWDWTAVKSRLEHLPDNRRILILFSGYHKFRELEDLFTAQGREFIKIPGWGAYLYILPKK